MILFLPDSCVFPSTPISATSSLCLPWIMSDPQQPLGPTLRRNALSQAFGALLCLAMWIYTAKGLILQDYMQVGWNKRRSIIVPCQEWGVQSCRFLARFLEICITEVTWASHPEELWVNVWWTEIPSFCLKGSFHCMSLSTGKMALVVLTFL